MPDATGERRGVIALVIASAGIVSATIAGASYLGLVLRGETNPHWISWLVWTLIGFTATWATYDGGAGATGVLVPSGFVVLTFAVFAISFRRSRAIVTRMDAVLGVVALATLVAWRSCGFSPNYAAIAAVAADACALYPTLRNAGASPSEPIRPWLWSSAACACGLSALDRYTFASTFYLAYALVAGLAVVSAVVVAGSRRANDRVSVLRATQRGATCRVRATTIEETRP